MRRNHKTIGLVILAVLVLMTSAICTSCGGGSNGEVYVYCYGDYYDPDLIGTFESETGIKVIADTYDTAEELYTVLENKSTSYDVICTSDYMIGKLIKEGMVSELNYDNIPEIKNIGKTYMEKSEEFDPGNKYSVPYQCGVAGIMYNTEMTKGDKIDSWSDLWNTKYSNQIVMPDSVRDAFMIALNKNGYSSNSTSEAEIKTAAQDLIKQKGMVYKYANDAARDLLADGSAAVGVIWNGEYSYVNDLNENTDFVVPKEGTEFFIDSWFIPGDVQNKDNAEAWINFMCRADVAAQNFDYLYYTTPNEAAKEIIEDKDALKNEAIFPSEETLARCQLLSTLDNDTTDLYSKYWKQVKAE